MATVVPSATVCFSTPDADAGTTLLALSVSSSKSGSPAFTADPSGFSQRARIPSEIDSPTPGTVMATAGISAHSLLQRQGDVGVDGVGVHQVGQRGADGGLDQLALLALVHRVRAGRR